MKTHTITTYSFSELSTEAQTKAIETRQACPYNGDHEAPEAWETAKVFNGYYPPRKIVSLCRREQITRYNVSDWEESYHEQEPPEGHRAWVWLLGWVDGHLSGVGMDWRKAIEVLGSCPLTGVFYDCEVLDPIRKALEGNPRECPDVDSIFEECGEQLSIALDRAIDWHSSEECIRDWLSNCGGDFEYLETGEVYS